MRLDLIPIKITFGILVNIALGIPIIMMTMTIDTTNIILQTIHLNATIQMLGKRPRILRWRMVNLAYLGATAVMAGMVGI